MTKFKPGDVVRYTDIALEVPEKGWYGHDKKDFVLPALGEFIVAKYNNDYSGDITLNNGSSWSDTYFELVRGGDFDNVEMYLVGGAVRDRLMGNPHPKDLDFTIVAHSFAQMQAYLIAEWGVESFVQQEEYGTVRGRFTPIGEKINSRYFADITLGTQAGDFVLSRKEGYYTDGRHPDDTTAGTLYDDLARRDLTINAIAMDNGGTYHDPFNGQEDIQNQLIRAVGNPKDRFAEDALRAIRALRFFVTLGFDMDESIVVAFDDEEVMDHLVHRVSTERVRDEIEKCFKHDVLETLSALSDFPGFIEVIFDKKYGHGIGLQPTTKKGY